MLTVSPMYQATPRRLRVTIVALLATVAAGVPAAQASAQMVEEFAIGYGDTVADGAPAPGAGTLEVPGATDTYTFHAELGDTAILDVLAGSNTTFLWSLNAPNGSSVFDGIYVDRSVPIAETGTYTLTIRGFSGTDTGTYSLRLLQAPAGEAFAITVGVTVSDGVPAPGAGNLEAPGATDTYTFDAGTGTAAVFDALSASTNVVRWALVAPDGTELFDSLFVDRQLALPQTGTYALTLSGVQITSSGTYSFRVLEVPAAAEYAIAFGDTVSEDVPVPGAGNLEAPGAIDVYTFEGTAGRVARLDVLAGNAADFSWRLTGPGGDELFDDFLTDRDIELTESGTHRLEVRGTFVDRFGTYSFHLGELAVHPPPVAPDDDAETAHGTAVTIDVLANDSDPDGDSLVIEGVSAPTSGSATATVTAGSVTYTPDPGFAGTDEFSYTIDDGNGGTAGATVTVTVFPPPNEAPTIEPLRDRQDTEGDAVMITVEATDPDGDELVFSADGLPAGIDIDASSGRISGTIDTGAAGTSPYAVTVSVTDPDGATVSAAFTWTVDEPADPDEPQSVRVDVWPPCVWSGVGVIAVVIHGDPAIDAAAIDARTVVLDGMPVARFLGRPLAWRADVDRDGHLDLLALIQNRPGGLRGGVLQVVVSARLHDGTEIAGTTRLVVFRPPFWHHRPTLAPAPRTPAPRHGSWT